MRALSDGRMIPRLVRSKREAGAQSGDVLESINGRRMTFPADIVDVISESADTPVTLELVREGQPLTITPPSGTPGTNHTVIANGLTPNARYTLQATFEGAPLFEFEVTADGNGQVRQDLLTADRRARPPASGAVLAFPAICTAPAAPPMRTARWRSPATER